MKSRLLYAAVIIANGNESIASALSQSLSRRIDVCSELHHHSSGDQEHYESSNSPTEIKDFIEEAINGLLCLHRENSVVKGIFYDHVKEEGVPTDLRLKDLKRANFRTARSPFIEKNDSDTTEEGSYKKGDSIQSIQRYESTSDDEHHYRNVDIFSIPAASDGGFCATNSQIRLGSEVEKSCVRIIQDLETDCQDFLDIEKHMNSSLVLKSKVLSSSVNYDNSSSSNIEIEISSIRHEDETIPINLRTSYSSKEDGSLKECQRAVIGVTYEVSISSEGSSAEDSVVITGVRASFDVMNVTETSNKSVSIRQAFRVKFVPSSNVSNTATRINSGYVPGQPILSAVKTDAGTIASEDVFKIQKSGDSGSCVHNASLSQVVGFGEDTSTGCSILLTRNELKEMCIENDHPHLQRAEEFTALVPSWLMQSLNVVGTYSNSDTSTAKEWVEIGSSEIVSSRIWNSAQNQCDGLISSVHYSFVWTFSGNIGDPQAEIISINREYNNGQTLRHRNDSKNKQPYYFETTISWIFLPGKTETLQLPPPNLFFSVPDDFFYPFSLSRS